ncbi:maleylpyruvate isomerase family mycothiol-dependent enzyme [Occultella kanbiaonis]|uniref:maleylpyruvate isomerase family mycothiol-dependent enzyme n=1 Tax=Occultella kanbiaonis TaxID=2675754 RepID=UPI0012B8C745|nr:maleylpyruvate isomerase family mycothiol-dependent enzyme [Occultella kanbiaonis]
MAKDTATIWPTVHAERAALIEDLRDLPAERWSTPSLCPGWSVHDVLAHLVDDARTTTLSFVGSFVRAGFDFDRFNDRGVARERAADPAQTLAAFESVSRRSTGAPAPLPTRLVEAIVHGEDIRRPLGIEHDYPPAAAVTAIRHQLATSTKMGGGRERAAGLRLTATDADLTVGDGEHVRGSAVALLLALSGRPVRPGELTGPGVQSLTG